MAIKQKRSLVTGSIPTTSSLVIGELAMNIPDGRIFFRKSGSGSDTVQSAITTGAQNSGSVILTGSLSLYGTGSVLEISGDIFQMNSDLIEFTGSFIITGSAAITGSLGVTNGITGSLQGTSSWASNAITASYVLQAISASFASTASSADNFTVRNTLTAQTIVVQTITSSIDFVTGSSRFGSLITNTHQFTGSVGMTGSLTVIGPVSASSFTGSISGTASFATSASSAISSSWASNADLLDGVHLSILATTGSNTFVGNQTVTGSVILSSSAVVELTVIGNQVNTGSITSTVGFTGSLLGTASTASFVTTAQTASYVLQAVSASFATTAVSATTASYILNAVSASFASTASFINTLNQNVLITGSLTVGASTAGSSENTLTLGPRGTAEGGQLMLQSPTSASYTSASMLDVYADSGTGDQYVRILRGSNAGSDALVAQFNLHTKQLNLPAYVGPTSFPGTAAAYLAVTNTGAVITTSGSGGGGAGSGTVNNGTAGYIAYYPSTGTTIDDTSGVYWDAGNSRLAVGNASPSYKLDVSGDIRATGAVYANANGTMYFRGGDDAELWDINVVNTIGIYGQQDQGVASIKLGSGGGTISGRSGSIGIGTITPTSASLTVNGNVWATSLTGSLQGTSSWANNAITSSYILQAVSASFATTATNALTASSADSFTVRGTLTAQTIVTQIITSSIDFVTGSTRFGSLTSNTHQFTGSVGITGSLALTGALDIGPAEFNATSSATTAGTTIVSSYATGSYNSAFYNYYITSASNARAGQIMSVWSGSTIQYSEVTTNDIGNTNTASFAVTLATGNVRLSFTAPGVWTVRSIVNLL